MRRYEINVIWLIVDLVAVFSALILFILNSDGDYNRLVAAYTLAAGVISLVKVRKNWCLLAVYGCILYCNYSICYANYLSYINSYFVRYSSYYIGAIGLNILMIFAVLLLLAAPDTAVNMDGTLKNLTVNNKDNTLIVYILLAVLTFIWIYGFTRPDAAGQRGSPSTMYEYSIIFIILALYYSGNNKLHIILVVGMAALYALQNFIYGGRITGLQLLICIVLCLYADKLTFKTVIPAGILLLFLMATIGTFRASFVMANGSVARIWKLLSSKGFSLDTAYSSYYTSMTFLVHSKVVTWSQRLYLFSRWVMSIFGGGAVSNSNLSIYTRQFYTHYYGGLLPFYAYFYLGYPGIIMIAGYLRYLFKKIAEAESESVGFQRCAAIYISSTAFRWYLYSPSQIFRGILLLAVTYVLLLLTDNFMKNGTVLEIRVK